jgi:hypothetical protein
MIAALAGLVIACRGPWWACPDITGALRATAIAAAVMTPGQAGRVRGVLMFSPFMVPCVTTSLVTACCSGALKCR